MNSLPSTLVGLTALLLFVAVVDLSEASPYFSSRLKDEETSRPKKMAESSYIRFGKRSIDPIAAAAEEQDADDSILDSDYSFLLQPVINRARRASESSYIRFGKRSPSAVSNYSNCVAEQLAKASSRKELFYLLELNGCLHRRKSAGPRGKRMLPLYRSDN